MGEELAAHGERKLLSRRTVLRTAALGTAGLVVATVGEAKAHGSLTWQTEIYGHATWYENLNNGATYPSGFNYNPTFYSQLENWIRFWYVNTPSWWVTPLRLDLNGVHVDPPASSGQHNYGRAIDISRISLRDSRTGGTFTGFAGRWDLWRWGPDPELSITR